MLIVFGFIALITVVCTFPGWLENLFWIATGVLLWPVYLIMWILGAL